MSLIASLSGVPAAANKKRKRKDTVSTVERLRDLFTENTTIQQLRNGDDLLERIALDSEGTDLRAVVAKIGALVQTTCAEYNLLHERMAFAAEQAGESTASFMQRKMAPEDVRALNHLFNSVLENNPNDDKARVAQLAIVFVALTIEVDVRVQLTAPQHHADRFETPDAKNDTKRTIAQLVAQQKREQKERANQIQRRPLLLFLKNDARTLLTQMTDSVIDLRMYVSQCLSRYLSYKPAFNPRVALQYYDERTLQ
jgi:hypothetical protein